MTTATDNPMLNPADYELAEKAGRGAKLDKRDLVRLGFAYKHLVTMYQQLERRLCAQTILNVDQFGTRYLAVEPILQYVSQASDEPRNLSFQVGGWKLSEISVPNDPLHQIPVLYSSYGAARQIADRAAIKYKQPELAGRVLVVSIPHLVDADWGPEECYAHAELMMLRYAADEQRLRPLNEGAHPDEVSSRPATAAEMLKLAAAAIAIPRQADRAGPSYFTCRACDRVMEEDVAKLSGTPSLCPMCAGRALLLLATDALERDQREREITSPSTKASP